MPDCGSPLLGIEPELGKQRLCLCNLCFGNPTIRLGDKAQQRKRGFEKLRSHQMHRIRARQLKGSPQPRVKSVA